MEALKSYLYIAMLAALVSAIIIRVSEPRYRKYIRFGAGLCLLLTLTAPLINLSDELKEFVETPASITSVEEENLLIGEIGREMSKQIGDLVAKQFAIPREKIRVKLTLDITDLSAISLVRIDLKVCCRCDTMSIESYLSGALGCPVQVEMNNTEEGEYNEEFAH